MIAQVLEAEKKMKISCSSFENAQVNALNLTTTFDEGVMLLLNQSANLHIFAM